MFMSSYEGFHYSFLHLLAVILYPSTSTIIMHFSSLFLFVFTTKGIRIPSVFQAFIWFSFYRLTLGCWAFFFLSFLPSSLTCFTLSTLHTNYLFPPFIHSQTVPCRRAPSRSLDGSRTFLGFGGFRCLLLWKMLFFIYDLSNYTIYPPYHLPT